MSQPGFRPMESDFTTFFVNLYATLGRAEQLPPWGVWSGDRDELSSGRREFLSFEKLHYTICFLPEPPRENSAETKNDSGFLQGKPRFSILS